MLALLLPALVTGAIAGRLWGGMLDPSLPFGGARRVAVGALLSLFLLFLVQGASRLVLHEYLAGTAAESFFLGLLPLQSILLALSSAGWAALTLRHRRREIRRTAAARALARKAVVFDTPTEPGESSLG